MRFPPGSFAGWPSSRDDIAPAAAPEEWQIRLKEQHMHSFIRRPLFRTLALALLGLTLGAGGARAEFLVALGATTASQNVLVSFDSNTPGTTSGPIAISGVSGRLLDIDFRPANGQLIGLNDGGVLYAINASNGIASQISTLNVALTGTQSGIDFNPTVDRLRIVGNGTQNLRVNGDTGGVTVDTALGLTGIVGAAYTNNFSGATTTTLFDLQYTGTAFNLVTQTNPNGGTFNTPTPTGLSSAFGLVGFDISGLTGTAFAATNTTSGTALLSRIDLNTGAATSLGTIDGGTGFIVRGLAAPVGAAAVPEPASVAMLGLGIASVALFARRRPARTA